LACFFCFEAAREGELGGGAVVSGRVDQKQETLPFDLASRNRDFQQINSGLSVTKRHYLT